VLDRLPKNLAECLAESLRVQVDDSDGIAGANHGRARARRALGRVPADGVCTA
jgi:hypothetical protein